MSSPVRPAPPMVLGFVSLGHSCHAIARNALAYSNIRRAWWPLAYLDLPLLFMLFGALHASQLDSFASLGRASAHLQRPDGAGEVKPPARARLLWLIVLGTFVLLFVVVPVGLILIVGPNLARTAVTTWLWVVLGIPIAGYAAPAVLQSIWIGRIQPWKRSTAKDTGREPAMVSMLGSWPSTGGRHRGTGDGFTLMKALAADARARNQIMIGAARGRRLASKYVHNTGAVRSPENPRHLRWP